MMYQYMYLPYSYFDDESRRKNYNAEQMAEVLTEYGKDNWRAIYFAKLGVYLERQIEP